VASALGAAVGAPRAVELTTPFDPRPQCRRSQTGRCAPLEAVAAEVTFEIAGGPTSSEDAREITATGVGVTPSKAPRLTSPSVRHSLRAARLAATSDAAKAARASAEGAASGAGLPLGPLFSIVEPGEAYGYEPLLGVFGPGQFCGLVRRATVRRDPETGERRVVRLRRVRRCYRPSHVAVRLEATYLGG
jgi:hypothetical protein